RKSRIKLFRNPLTALALLYAVVLLGCAPEGTTKILSYHGFVVGGGGPRHPGVDFAALVGGPVIAAADGVVVQAGFGWGCGNGVSIEHRAQEAPLGWTLYCHFTETNVREAQTVKRGDVLGTAGTSGQTGGVPPRSFWTLPQQALPMVWRLCRQRRSPRLHRRVFQPHQTPWLPRLPDRRGGLATRADLPGAVHRPGPRSVTRCVERRTAAGAAL